MPSYANVNGNSGVLSYEIGTGFIRLKFRHNPDVYTYSYKSAGKKHIEMMKKLAVAGKGLSTYVSQHVHDKYESIDN